MKSLTTLAAIAALVAGMSIANAQSNMSNSNAPKAAEQSTGAFCLTGKSGPKNCTFASVTACEKAAQSTPGTCAANAKGSTTSGSGQ